MYDAMFIVHSLEQSPVYWDFLLYKSWCVEQYFSPLLLQMKDIALLYNRLWAQKALLCNFGFDLAFFSLALCGAWQSFTEREERHMKQLCDL